MSEVTEHYDDDESESGEEDDDMTEEDAETLATVEALEDPIEKQNAAEEL